MGYTNIDKGILFPGNVRALTSLFAGRHLIYEVMTSQNDFSEIVYCALIDCSYEPILKNQNP